MVVPTTSGPRSGGNARTKTPELLDINCVAAQLCCSARHVRRLSDAGKLPRPVHLGALVRWLRADLEAWLAAGCPRVAARGERDHA